MEPEAVPPDLIAQSLFPLPCHGSTPLPASAWATRLIAVPPRVEMTDAAAIPADISGLSFEEALAQLERALTLVEAEL